MAFFEHFIKQLLDDGHTVDIATNDSVRKAPECYKKLGCRIFSLLCSRSPLDIGNIHTIEQIRRLVKQEQYDIVHCHTPIAAACARIACKDLRKKLGVKVFYTAHGFHFYKGAPLQNWLIYYPVEKLCAYFTDKLITINQEDYSLAKRKLHAKQVHYVPGVGVDLSKFENIHVDRDAKRREIGVPEGAFLLLSVGELNENKNHQIIIKALAKLNRPDVHYAIAGRGDKYDALVQLAAELGVSRQLHLLGYRTDIAELNCAADVFCFPSYREGLSVSMIEAMAGGLPVVCSRIRGNTDLVNEQGGVLFDPHDEEECTEALKKILCCDRNLMKAWNRYNAARYSSESIAVTMKSIYES